MMLKSSFGPRGVQPVAQDPTPPPMTHDDSVTEAIEELEDDD